MLFRSILFEFHFGDDGGTTSWPHIQVNTLRKLEDIPEEQRKIIEEQFFEGTKTPENISLNAPAATSGCPYHKG